MERYGNAELTPGLRRLVPEWYDKGTGQVNLKPTSRDLNRGNLVKRTDSFAKGDIEIVLANFAMHSDGKIPDVQVEKIEKSGYAAVRRMTSVRCVRCQRGRRGAPTSMLDGASMTLAESALGQGLLRRSPFGQAPSGYGRLLGT